MDLKDYGNWTLKTIILNVLSDLAPETLREAMTILYHFSCLSRN